MQTKNEGERKKDRQIERKTRANLGNKGSEFEKVRAKWKTSAHYGIGSEPLYVHSWSNARDSTLSCVAMMVGNVLSLWAYLGGF